jgi:undecaprenyl diphosphate synthase
MHIAIIMDGNGRWACDHLAAVDCSAVPVPEVDLLIRTGGEKRLSDFLLWECAYAELLFVDSLWPDFDKRAFEQALDAFARRDRRYGQIASPGAARVNHG